MSDVIPAPAPAPAPVPAPAPAPEYKAPESQDALDRIVEARLKREREKYADYDELKEAKSKYDELLEAQKTDAQKAIDAAKGEATSETTQKFLTKLVHGEVKAQAATAGFNDPADALQILGATLPVKDDEPDADEIKKLVEQLAKDKPYLLKDASRPKPAVRPKPAGGGKPDNETHEGKGRAAAALRQLGVNRKGGST
jgi:hypothetical protein